ncbi:MAG TPA: DUF1254 domain-containing protein [Candidatus Elarobacter sp.]|jgi:DNA sulfur modification protein DndE|nr:DUF1254 domain-containing protein [Candidatus Elarobacter sp.]
MRPPRRRLASILSAVLVGLSLLPAGAAVDDAGAQAIAHDGYVFGYPLVLMEATRLMTTAGRAPGQFVHMASAPTPPFRIVVAPNGDTRYSSAWLDVSGEPMVVHVPDAGGRYFVTEMLDAWTDVIADPTARVAGSAPKDYAIAGPAWKGTVPPGVTVVRSSTDDVWVLARTRARPADDAAAITAIQQQYHVVPLSRYGDASYQPPAGAMVDPDINTGAPPPARVAALSAAAFFSLLAGAMVRNPPRPADAPIVARLASIGVVAGHPFDPNALGPGGAASIELGARDAAAEVAAYDPPGVPHVNGWRWTKDTGRFGTAYMYRAFIANTLLAANLPEDAVYPETSVDANGEPLNGGRRYTLHFAPGELPPVNGFWSLTLYGADHFLVPNSINRYTLRDTGVARNADGSVDVRIQAAAPAGDTTNWLPSPATGPFVVTLRMYWAKPAGIDGSYHVPPIVPVPG